MKRLFLTSSTNFVSQHLVKHINLTKENKLVFINTPAEVEEGDKQWLEDDRRSLVDAGFDVVDYSITGKNKIQLKKDLANFDILYVSGGNTFYMLQQSLKTGFFNLVRDFVNNQGKIYIGTSAGSIIAGPRLLDYLLDLGEENIDDKLIGAEGFNFVDFIILPHWGSEGFKDLYLKSNLNKIYKKNQYPLLFLTDQQYVKIEEEKIEIFDVARC